MQIQPVNKDWLITSWGRSEQAGLKQRRLPEHIRLPNYELKERKWRATAMIDAINQRVLPLFEQMYAHSDSRLILTDQEGIILATWGQPKFRERLLQIALEPGSCWQEKVKGTNAIGTALIETKPISVIGEQHFIRQHQFISCSASPIFDYQGNLLGVLDITSEQQQHDVSTQVLVHNMVQLIENHLITHLPDGSTRIDLAMDKSMLDSGWQGIVIADSQGKIMAHNEIATHLIDKPLEAGLHLQDLLDHIPKRIIYETKPINHPAPKQVKIVPDISCEPKLHYGDETLQKAWQQATQLIDHDIPILLLGETGSGKGEFIKALHQASLRRNKPLITVNCSALAKELVESELFGYAPGAFTGASNKGYSGKIRAAHQGTLFLDEIGDMPLEVQTRLLQVLQDKVVVPVGCVQEHAVDIQIIAATHRPLEHAVEQGKFRQDLYYRLNGLTLRLPPLRDRQDKSALIRAIHHKYAPKHQTICPALHVLFSQYLWPGNLRELDNTMKVACLLASEHSQLKRQYLPDDLQQRLQLNKQYDPNSAHQHSPQPEDNVEQEHTLKDHIDDTLLSAFESHSGNISQTARTLGISRNTLYRKLRAIGILE
ncbi:sigma-54-dependent Fis family transcriptional regulator [Vibrio nitrifigilis]|uniref:Sigma-54-dependent Fis family transcriptional regulator n=1 Tax=Vibrio nitrifigilis TaxID=2789781 RepID=A0ABS0GL06_9VIBR|nr:sigma-54-dependent Fis family transcriptional regulator [Vibrio nitrifigilis]MBF9003159.1 sigma-54-dependent Fis family transcriptional regulator [Vibrio nitrifigilis]